jgi:phosphoglycolate phosphatase
MKPILLFDIDGTLLNVKKSFSKELFAGISDELDFSFGHMKNSSFAGRTDKDIFEELASVHPRSDQFYEELKRLYLDYMMRNLLPRHIALIEGAFDAVMEAKEKGYKVGLCTGNFRETAYVKVEAAGFPGVFGFGGFGCRHTDRIHIPLDAHTDFVEKYGYTPASGEYVVIGDTPNDIRCAKYFGAVSLAVPTGNYSMKELEKEQPDVLLSDLFSLSDWLDLNYG